MTQVIVDSMAWVSKTELSEIQIESLREKLTVHPKVMPGETPKPLPLYAENDRWFGMPRAYYMARRQPHHRVEIRGVSGAAWPGELPWNPAVVLRPEQQRALDAVVAHFRSGGLGGLVRAPPGWGKTVFSLRLIAEPKVPTLVVVHKDFLARQWRERIFGNQKKGLKPLLPDAKVGVAQGPELDFQGKHIVIGMVHTLGSKPFPREFLHWPGLVLVDECHRIGAPTWAPTPTRFPSRYRIGVTATPRRKDGAERVFLDHIGPMLFVGEEQRLPFRVRRVWTGYKPPKRGKAPLEGLAAKAMLLTLMVASSGRNAVITEQLVLAVRAGRKVIVLSERLDHLDRLDALLRSAWLAEWGPAPTTGKYVGGMTPAELEVSETANVVFATYQYAAEGLDIPPLDTLFLASPASDVEQAVGRIRRPFEGKKECLVVDFRDEAVPAYSRAAEARDRFYQKSGVT